MNAALALVIVLSHQGYWLGGDQNNIGVQWAVRGGQPAADLRWELSLGEIKVSSGATAILPDPAATVIQLTPPAVRVRVSMQWKYTLNARDGGKELDHGELPLEIFPESLLDGMSSRIGRSRLAVWDDAEELRGILDRHKVTFTRVTNLSKLGFARPQAVVVGRAMLDGSPFTAGPLIEVARGGASVMILCQNRTETIDGYNLVRRRAPASLDWLVNHPLLRGMDLAMLKSIEHESDSFLAVRLPADEPALAIAAWPRELPGVVPVAVDALLVTKSVGRGRIVFCQLPLNDWKHDPRAQLFLSNSMDYLLSSPEPTPPASERAALKRVATPAPPGSTLVTGDRS